METPEKKPRRSAKPRDFYAHGLDDFISAASLILTNTGHPDIAPRMVAAGYTPEVVAGLRTDLEALRKLAEEQAVDKGASRGASKGFYSAFAAARKTVGAHVGLARIALAEDLAARIALGIDPARKQAYGGFVDQSLLFYTGALAPDAAAIAEKLAAKGLTATMLEEGRDAIQSLTDKKAVQKAALGAARTSTRRRNEAWAALREQISAMRQTARIVLAPQPQTLEMLGIVARSGKG